MKTLVYLIGMPIDFGRDISIQKVFMFPYRKILELHGYEVSLREIAMITRHSRQKITEVF